MDSTIIYISLNLSITKRLCCRQESPPDHMFDPPDPNTSESSLNLRSEPTRKLLHTNKQTALIYIKSAATLMLSTLNTPTP